MIRFAIVEDDEEQLMKGISFISKYCQKQGMEYSVTDFESSEDYLSSENRNFDIHFLDIQLPGMDGMELARKIREKDKNTIIVFVTNMSQFAIIGYEVEALDFIVKPLKEGLFMIKMDRIIEKLNMTNNDKISFSINRQPILFAYDSITYIETSNHNLSIFTSNGKSYKARAALNSVEEDFSKHHFFRVSSYAMVNLKYVEGMDHDDILIGQRRVRVSRPRKKDFLNELSNYLGKN